VKSSSGLKEHYIDDMALQSHVLRGAGVALASIELLHVNTGYVRGASGIVWPEFFARLDVGDEVASALVVFPGRPPATRERLSAITQPAPPGAPRDLVLRRRRDHTSKRAWVQCRVSLPDRWRRDASWPD
jgi:hypothetical protein